MTTATAIARAEIEAALVDAERTVERLRAVLADLDGAAGLDGAGGAVAEPEHHDPSDLIDTNCAAERAGLPEDTIRYWCRQDSTFGTKIGGRWFVSSRALSRKIRTRGA